MSEKRLEKRIWSFIVVCARRAKIAFDFVTVFESVVSWKWIGVLFGTVITFAYTTAPVALPWAIRGILVIASLWLLRTGWTGAKTTMFKMKAERNAPRLIARQVIPVGQAVNLAKESSAVLYRLPLPGDGNPANTVKNEKAKNELARDLVRRFMAANPGAVSGRPHPIFEGAREEFVAEAEFSGFLDRESTAMIDRVRGPT